MTPNTGKRRRITIDGEHYYLIVSDGPDGYQVDITCPRENAPENAKLRGMFEAFGDPKTRTAIMHVCRCIDSMLED